MNIQKSIIFSIIRTFFSIARGFIFIQLITTQLSESAYGLWSVIYTIIITTVAIGGLHLNGSLIRFISKSKNENQVFSDIMIILTLLYAFIFILGILILNFFTGLDLRFIFIILFLIFIELFIKIESTYYRATQKVVYYELILIAKLLLDIIIFIIAIEISQGIQGGFYSLIISGIIILSCLTYDLSSNFVRPDFSNWNKYLKYGIPMVPREASAQMIANTDRFLLLYYISQQAVGIYVVCYTFSAISQHIITVLKPVFYPLVVNLWDQNDQNSLSEAYTKIFQIVSILLLPAGIGLAMLADDIILLTSTRLIATQSTSLVPILLVGFILKALREPLEFIFNARQENKILAIFLIIGTVVNVILNIILIPRIGLVGAAWATLAAHVVILILLSNKILSYIYFGLDYKLIIYSTLSSSVMFVVISQIETQEPLLNVILLPILGAFCYFTTIYIISGGQIKSIAIELHQYTQ